METAFNMSSSGSGKAQSLQPHSLRALISSLSSAGGLLVMAVAVSWLTHASSKLAIVNSPRQHLFQRTRALPVAGRPLAMFYHMWTGFDSTVLHDCGIEALLFLHYLRSLFVLFGLLTVSITPSIACFNYFATVQPASTDWLNMLSWSNLSIKDARSYWLYAILAPLTNGFTLWMFSRDLARAVQLRSKALRWRPIEPGAHGDAEFFVVVENLPVQWNVEEVREYYTEWRDHITGVYPVPVHAGGRNTLATLTSLTQTIEARETSFIADLMQQSQAMDDISFQAHLGRRLRERYTSSGHATGLLEKMFPSISTLYGRLNELTASRAGCSMGSSTPTRSMSVLIRLDSYHQARALADYPHSSDMAHCRAHFLGSSVTDLIVANMGHVSYWIELRRAGLQYLTTILVVVWTFPMALIGGLSQLSVLVELVPGLSARSVPVGVLGMVQGVVPSVATSILMWLFPRCLQAFVDRAGHFTHTDGQLSTQSNYFFFLFVQLFLNPSIASGLVPTIFEVLNTGVTEVPRILARNLPLAGNYYLSYILVQAILLAVSTLFRPFAWFNLYRASRRGTTPREKVNLLWNVLFQARWGELYPLYSVLAVIVITYSLLTPLILVIATIAFGIAYLCYRHTFLYLADFVIDTRGRLYFPAFFDLFLGLYAQQLTLIGLFILKFDLNNKAHDLGQLAILLITSLGCVQYHTYLKRRFDPLIRHQEGATAKSPHTTSLDPGAEESPPNTIRPRFHVPIEDQCVLSRVQAVVWLPQDERGISTSLIESVTTACLSPISTSVTITDTGAVMTQDGHVALRNHDEEKQA